MKAIYFYDSKTKLFTSVDLIANDEEVPANATLVQPIAEDGSGLYDPKWDGTQWVGCAADEYEEKHKNDSNDENEPYTPSDIEKSITALSEQLAEEQEQLNQLQKVITDMNMDGDK